MSGPPTGKLDAGSLQGHSDSYGAAVQEQYRNRMELMRRKAEEAKKKLEKKKETPAERDARRHQEAAFSRRFAALDVDLWLPGGNEEWLTQREPLKSFDAPSVAILARAHK
eukprot:1291623-Alexandrium_andersonii.AAC.1